MKALVLIEHDGKQLAPASLSAVCAALQITQDVSVCVIGTGCEKVAQQAALLASVKEVVYVDAPCYLDPLAENISASVVELGKNFTHILATATAFGKNVMPRVAALLNVPQLSDITAVVSPNTFVRPIYAGNAFTTVQNEAPIQVLTVRRTAFSPVGAGSVPAPIRQQAMAIAVANASLVSRESVTSNRPDLGAAKVVVAGGRGLQSKENFKLLENLADKLHGAVGASRAAVDAGLVPTTLKLDRRAVW